ncbi:MAG: DUF4956 domain-containing protein [Christensenellales bacterium]
MFDSIFDNTAADAAISLPGLLLALGAALCIGLLISLVYMKTRRNAPPSQSFALTLVMLPAIVTVIILLVGSNIARAFSLSGAFAIIRFRSAPGDAKDITYVLFCMAVGLAAGMGFVLYAVVMGVILCAAMALLELLKYGRPKGTSQILKITIPENLDYQHAFDSVMNKYTSVSKLNKVKTTNLGSLYELVYSVTTKQDISEKAFIDELRCRNGNLNITLVLDATPDEF